MRSNLSPSFELSNKKGFGSVKLSDNDPNDSAMIRSDEKLVSIQNRRQRPSSSIVNAAGS